jgi:hypothetical protein
MMMRCCLLCFIIKACAAQFTLFLQDVYERDVIVGFSYEAVPEVGQQWTEDCAVCIWSEFSGESTGNAVAVSAGECKAAQAAFVPLQFKDSGSYTISAAVAPQDATAITDSILLSDVVKVKYAFNAMSSTKAADADVMAKHPNQQYVELMRAKLLQEGPSEQRESLWEKFHEQVRQLLLDPAGDPFMIRTKPELRAFMEPCVPSACVEQLQLLQAHPRWSTVIYLWCTDKS